MTCITGGSSQYKFSQKISILVRNWVVLARITSFLREESQPRLKFCKMKQVETDL